MERSGLSVLYYVAYISIKIFPLAAGNPAHSVISCLNPCVSVSLCLHTANWTVCVILRPYGIAAAETTFIHTYIHTYTVIMHCAFCSTGNRLNQTVIYKVIIVSDIHCLPLPVGSCIISTYRTRFTSHNRGGGATGSQN
jgi:hypothetical protein